MPLVGTWIEMVLGCVCRIHACVVPLVGTWIEILSITTNFHLPVVPLVGTWIEIKIRMVARYLTRSCPSWARGLKFPACLLSGLDLVVPLVGTWIEILFQAL